jgi:hypothetical protein
MGSPPLGSDIKNARKPSDFLKPSTVFFLFRFDVGIHALFRLVRFYTSDSSIPAIFIKCLCNPIFNDALP